MIGAASDDGTRYVLNGIKIEADGSAIATDGHMALKITPAMDCYEYGKDYPVIEGMDVMGKFDKSDDPKMTDTPKEKLEPFILPSDAVYQLLKALPRRHRLPVLEHVAIDVAATNKNGFAVLGTTDLETPQVFKPKKLDLQFPDYTKVIPGMDKTSKWKAKVSVGFSIALLEKLVRTLKSMDVKAVEFGIVDAVSTVKVNNEGDVITGAVMPYRIK